MTPSDARALWRGTADDLLRGAVRYRTPAGIAFPGQLTPVSPLEGLARVFMLAGIRAVDGAGLEPASVDLQWWDEAFARGSDPAGPHAWPDITPHGQEMVEAAGLALAFTYSREHTWDLLSDRTRTRLVDWLSQGTGHACADNNHVLFGALIQAFLHSVGAPAQLQEVDRAFSRLQDWYRGDGWYTDGPGRRFDHYNGWALHLYPAIIAQLRGEDEWLTLFRDRLRMFLTGYAATIDDAGRPLHQGRSLIYRWAAATPLWAGELFDASPLPPGQVRHLATGMLREFLASDPFPDGALSHGWFGPFEGLTQGYSGPGSAYWTAKGFLGLLLPAEHPVWTAPAPTEPRVARRVLSAPAWLTSSSDGLTRVYNGGSDGHPHQDADYYRRLAFSTVTGPEVNQVVRDNLLDVAASADGPGGTHLGTLATRVQPNAVATRYRLDVSGREVTVDVITALVGDAEIRVGRVTGAAGLLVRLSGWPVAETHPPTHAPLPGAETHGGVRAVTAAGLGSTLIPLIDPIRPALPAHIHSSRGSNAFGAHSAVPVQHLVVGDELRTHIGAICHLGTTADSVRSLGPIDVEITDTEVTVTLAGAAVSVPWAQPEPRHLGQRMFSQVPSPVLTRLTYTPGA